MTVPDPDSPTAIRRDLYQFLVDRFADKLEIFTDTYLSVVKDHVNWGGDRTEQARELVNEVSARNMTAQLWQALRDELLPKQPAFAAEIDRLEEAWRDDSALLWEAIGEAAKAASNKVIEDLPFDPELYLPRARMDGVMSDFLAGQYPAMIMTGQSGVGKTMFGVDWTQRLSRDGVETLFLAGKWMTNEPVWDQIAAALDVDMGNWLQWLGAIARDTGKRLVIIIDGIHETPDRDGGVKAFESLNSRLPDVPDEVRILVTVTEPSWRRLVLKARRTIRRGRYFTGGGDPAFALDPFDKEELRSAWSRYQKKFAIATQLDAIPPGLSQQLRNPTMMHLLALAYEGGALPGQEVITTSDFFRKYFETKVDPGDERTLLERIASLMYESAKTPMDRSAMEGDALLRGLVSDSVESPYSRLLDKDVIREVEDDGPFLPGRFVEYSIQRFGAWLLASYLAKGAREAPAQAEIIARAALKFATFPPAWDAASMLLVQMAKDEVFLELAGSERTEVRELVIDSIAELAIVSPDRVKGLVDKMLQVQGASSGLAHRTALRAAYRATLNNPNIPFHETFETIARGPDDDLRESLHDTLYLAWRNDPAFTVGVLQKLVSGIDLGQVIRPWDTPSTRRVIELLARVVITLYTTHPTVEFGRKVGDLGHELIVDRLRIAGILGNEVVQKLVFPIVDRGFSGRIYKGFLVNDEEALEKVFKLDAAAKDDFRTGIRLLDPDEKIDAHVDLLGRLLGAVDSDISSLLAAQAIGVHLVADFPSARPVAVALHAGGDRRAQAWLLTSFMVLLETTPPEWVPFLEELTQRTVDQNPGILSGREGTLTQGHIDQVLLPLGLAYGKRGTDMPLFAGLINSLAGQGDHLSVARCIRAFGSIGFYHPLVVRDTIGQVWSSLTQNGQEPGGEIFEAFVAALVAIRTLHPNYVDDLLLDLASESLQMAVRNAAEPAWLRPQVSLLGLFNNGVHEAVCNPIMRENLLIPIYEMLIEGTDVRHAVQGLTKRAWDLVEEHEFRLDRWMGPATGGVCC